MSFLPFYRPWSGHLNAGISCSNGPKLRPMSVLQRAGWISYKRWPKAAVCRGRECEWLPNHSVHTCACKFQWRKELVQREARQARAWGMGGSSSRWTTTFSCRTFPRCFAYTISFNPAEHFRVVFYPHIMGMRLWGVKGLTQGHWISKKLNQDLNLMWSGSKVHVCFHFVRLPVNNTFAFTLSSFFPDLGT